MKRTISLMLALLLSLALAVPAWAADPVEEENAAWSLYHLGLFQGTDTDEDGFPVFSLDTAPTRAQGVTMLVRLLGQEEAALERPWTAPFADVPDWAKPYVGYAYEEGLTTGRSETVFDPDSTISATEYLTFLLRALGYVSGEDFAWDAAWTLSDKLGLTDGSYNQETNLDFDRGDVAVLSAGALDIAQKGSDQTLREKLAEQGISSETERCLWTESCESVWPGKSWYAFTPLKDSSEVYTRFVMDKATVNGQPCTIAQQYETAKDRKAYLTEQEMEKTYLEDAFALACLTYDEKAALAAAETFVERGDTTYPVLVFHFWATGTLKDGTEVKESFSLSGYLDGYGGPLE